MLFTPSNHTPVDCYSKCMLGYFSISITHWTLMWTTYIHMIRLHAGPWSHRFDWRNLREIQSLACSGYPLEWWPMLTRAQFGFREQVLMLSATNCPFTAASQFCLILRMVSKVVFPCSTECCRTLPNTYDQPLNISIYKDQCRVGK